MSTRRMRMMLKVIFVDDEPLIREGLKGVIDWNQFGYEVIGTAENGRTGLDMIRFHRPDLALVDIKMPGLNGIDMAEQAKKEGLQTKFVILSGYSQFAYAQKAIQLGMESYLLKPIDEEELIPLIESIALKCNEERKWKQRQQQYERYSLASEWKRLFTTNNVSHRLSELYREISFEIVSVKDFKGRDGEHVRSILQHYLPEETHYIWIEENMYLLLKESKMELHTWERIAEVEQLQFLCLGSAASLDQVTIHFESIQQLEKLSFHYGDYLVLRETDIVEKATCELEEDYGEKIISCLQFRDDDRLSNYFSQFETYCRKNQFTKERAMAEMVVILKDIYASLQQEHPDLELSLNKRVFSIVYESSHLQDMLEKVQNHLLSLSRELNIFLEPENLTERMVEYTKHFYYRELSLKTMAEIFHYNASYLGKKFKKETDMYFHHFLDEVRIEKAKELLLMGQWKVYEISAMIGYSNHDYFYKKFKKQTGMSPKEYQKSFKKGRRKNG